MSVICRVFCFFIITVCLSWASVTYATCDGCCKPEVQLLAWSEDGRAWVTLTRWEDEVTVYENDKPKRVPNEVISLWRWNPPQSPQVIESYSSYPEEVLCNEGVKALPFKGKNKHMRLSRVDVTKFAPFKSYKLKKVTSSWRSAFKKRIKRKLNRKKKAQFSLYPITTYGPECVGWDLIEQRTSKVIGWIPKQCEEGSAVSAKVLGGFLHPNGKYALVKVKYFLEGLVEPVRYELIPLF